VREEIAQPQDVTTAMKKLLGCIMGWVLCCAAGCADNVPDTCSFPDLDQDEDAITCASHPELCGVASVMIGAPGSHPNPVELVFVAEGYRVDELETFREEIRTLRRNSERDRESIIGHDPTLFNWYIVELASRSHAVSNASSQDTALGACLDDGEGGPFLRVRHARLLLAARSAVPQVTIAVAWIRNGTGRANAELPSFRLPSATVHPLDDLHVRASHITIGSNHGSDVFNHELGHSLVGLGDEYTEFSRCAPADNVRPPWLVAEGSSLYDWNPPNLTDDPTGRQWRSLVSGAIAGGARYACGIYHPTNQCRMLTSHASSFCPVCENAIVRFLERRRRGGDGAQQRCDLWISHPPDARYSAVPVNLRPRGSQGTQHAILRVGNEVVYDARWEEDYSKISVPVPQELFRPGVRIEATCEDGLGSSLTRTLTLPDRW
jgi:hypothetical protein